MSAPISVTLVGATGLTGSATLNALLSSTSQPYNIKVLARRAIETTKPLHSSTIYSPLITPNLNEVSSVSEPGGVYISCLATTRAAAGGFKEQEKIDVHLNRDLAQKARKDGAKQLILVSSNGANSKSSMPYLQMKGALEDAVKGMGFESRVILQPGMLLGPRDYKADPRFLEKVAQNAFKGLRAVGLPVSSLCVDSADVGATIAYFASHPPTEKITIVDNWTIIQTAKTWRELQQKQ